MADIKSQLRQAHEQHLQGIAAGGTADIARAESATKRSLSLIAASKVIDVLGPDIMPSVTCDEVINGKRRAVAVERSRSADAVIPAGLKDGAPAQRVHFEETKSCLYNSYPFGLRGLFPVLRTHKVVMLTELTEGDDAWPQEITLQGSSMAGVRERLPTSLELDVFSENLELVARAEDFDNEMAAQGLLWSRQMEVVSS